MFIKYVYTTLYQYNNMLMHATTSFGSTFYTYINIWSNKYTFHVYIVYIMSNAVTYIMIFLYSYVHTVLCVASSGWVQYSLTVSIALYTRYGGKYNMKHFHSYSYLNDYRISRRLIIVETCVYRFVWQGFFFILRYLVFDLSFKIISFLSTWLEMLY